MTVIKISIEHYLAIRNAQLLTELDKEADKATAELVHRGLIECGLDENGDTWLRRTQQGMDLSMPSLSDLSEAEVQTLLIEHAANPWLLGDKVNSYYHRSAGRLH